MLSFEKVNESAYTVKGDCSNEIDEIKPLLRAKIPNIQYSPQYKLGLISDTKNFFKQVDEKTLLVPRGLAIPLANKYNVELKNEIVEQVSMEEFKTFVDTLEIPFEPYDYQLQAALDCINNVSKICEMATGSGKSLTIYLIIRWFMEKLEKDEKILLIVPSIILLNQMYDDFESYGLKNAFTFVDKLGGDYKLDFFIKKVNITTWQSLYRNVELFKDIKVLIEDEVHKATSEVHEKIIYPSAINAKFRYGFTGTIPKDYFSKLCLSSILGSCKTYITPRQLIDRGLATELLIKPVIIKYNNATASILRNIKNYQQEISFILDIQERNKILAKLISKVSENGNTIVLFSRVENGKELAKLTCKLKYGVDIEIDELRKVNDYGIYFVSGDTKASDRENIRKIMEQKSNAVIFGTNSIISTGLNIKNLKNLVNTFPGKSYVLVNQSIGRILRTHESKNLVTLYDIVDDGTGSYKSKPNYLYKHFKERINFYLEQEHDIDTEIVIPL